MVKTAILEKLGKSLWRGGIWAEAEEGIAQGYAGIEDWILF